MLYYADNKEQEMNDLQWKQAFGRYEAELEQIQFALGDIAETLRIWRDEKPIDDTYIVKLYREWDELVVRKQKLLKGQRH